MKTQKEKILEHLLAKGYITSMRAFKTYSVTRLSHIIYVLRKKGFNIETINIVKKGKDGRTIQFGKYILHINK